MPIPSPHAAALARRAVLWAGLAALTAFTTLTACSGAPRNAECARTWSTCTDHCADRCEARPEVLPGNDASATVDTWSSDCDTCVGRCRDDAARCDERAERSLP